MSEGQPTTGGWARVRRSYWGIGVATLLVTVPVVLAVPRKRAWLVAFVVLCLYPLLEAPRNVARKSWWLGAALSTIVWIGVFNVLYGTADAALKLRESSFIFVVPMVMFPLVLGISGVVRLHRNRRRLPLEPGVRTATAWGGALCGLMFGIPWALEAIPAMIENSTGNTPPNTSFQGQPRVVASADAQQVTLRSGGPGPPSYRITPETRFGFMGSGHLPKDDQAGPDWLKPGQKVSVDYAFREHVAQARYIAVWIDRKGCAGDEAWAAMPPPGEDSYLVGTTWEGWRGTPLPQPVGDQPMVVELLAGGRIAYTGGGSPVRYTNGAWKKKGPAVLIEVNDCYAKYEGRLHGDDMTGEFSNEMGFRQPWTARRMAVH